MKATGIVRRIDELGRVVIPKEIRSTLRLKSGDTLLTTLEESCSAMQGAFGSDSAIYYILAMLNLNYRLRLNFK